MAATQTPAPALTPAQARIVARIWESGSFVSRRSALLTSMEEAGLVFRKAVSPRGARWALTQGAGFDAAILTLGL